MSVRVSYKKQFIFWIMFAVVILAIVEVGLRIWYYEDPLCNIIGSDAYKNVPDDLQKKICFDAIDIMWNYYPIVYIQPNQNLNTIHIDSDGFRGPEITKEKPTDTYRIFVVGGSAAFGWGSTSDDTTIAAYLQKDFESTHHNFKVQVINAGIGGALSLTEVEYVKNKLLDYKPDLIVIYDGYNDLIESARAANQPIIKESFADKIIVAYKKFFSFYKTPVIGQFLLNDIKTRGKSQVISVDDTPTTDQKSLLWSKRWSEICQLGKKQGFDTVITLQPFLGTGNKILSKSEHGTLIKTSNPQMLISYQSYANTLDSLKNDCSNVGDLRNTFDNTTDPIFYDLVHMGDEGNKIVAQKIFDLIDPIVSQKYSK